MNHPARVLIVEDQFLVAHDCEHHLREAGFECVGLAASAPEAVEIAQREHPDLILMDVRLATRTDGVEAAIEIFDKTGIRSIFTSGHADSETREQARRAQPLGWLPKPYTPENLVSAVAEAFQHSRSESSATQRNPQDQGRSGKLH